MNSQNFRYFLFAALVLIGSLLYNQWQEEQIILAAQNKVNKKSPLPGEASSSPNANLSHYAKQKSKIEENKNAELGSHQPIQMDSSTHQTSSTTQNPSDTEIPSTSIQEQQNEEEKNAAAPEYSLSKDREIRVNTDVLQVVIDSVGGDIVQLSLPRYKNIRESVNENYYVFDHSAERFYIAQSGLASEQGPDSNTKGRARYQTTQTHYDLLPNQDTLMVDLKTITSQNVEITKRFIFQKDSYEIKVDYIILNKSKVPYKGSVYTRLKRKPETPKNSGFLGMGAQTYTGAAVDTPETPYKKLPFKDIEEKPFEQTFMGGWVAMIERYFVSAWIPKADVTSTYNAFVDDGFIKIGFVENAITVQPNTSQIVSVKLYAGPQVTENLAKAAPGLELTVDYGILWPICQPIFWLLKQLYHLTNNWGVAIILITLLIKALFYRLSASSYRSMANMRKLQPKIESLKERYTEDKQKFSQTVMELYKKEKVNPLGGCLPILVQIPVFIALYYVLLGSVELRLAPFMLWITDLSEKDPYYVLPILMGLSMFIQQRLNPQPPDPTQAKVMMLMPVIFTVLFLNFPSGLVLYWLVSNVLSIIQQWVITKRIESSGKYHGVRAEKTG